MGQNDPQRLTGGARATWAGHAGLVGWATPSPTGSLAPAATGRGGSSGVGTEGERGPLGPFAHQEVTGAVCSAGGGETAANLAAVLSVPAGETAASGGDSGLLRSIPCARRRREARRSWGLARRRPGRLLAAA
jgi:hypothetical protein